MNKLGLLLALLAAPAQAAAPSSWAVVCTASCTAPDGTTQPAGTVLGKIWWDGAAAYPPCSAATTACVADTGQAVYAPPAPPPTTIGALAFLRRFSAAERAACLAANPAWGMQIAAAGTIDVTDPTLIADLAAAVAAGALTQARVMQVLNLNVTSP